LFDYAVVSNHVRNFPPKAVTGWMFRATGNIAPECLVYDPNGKAGW
jgi:hypothetical protein